MMETIMRAGVPVVGFGQGEAVVVPAAAAAVSPWALAVVTSAVGAATGWFLEEIATNGRRKGRR